MKDHSIFNLKKGGKEMLNRRQVRSDKGFTLIELVIVMVVLAIMAGLAIPKFLDLRADAKKSAANGALGGVRSAVANFHAKSIATNPDDATPYPTVTELTTDGTVINGAFPENPYYTGGAAKNSVGGCTTAKGTVDAANDTGWCYKVTQPGGPGDFWANTNTAGENLL